MTLFLQGTLLRKHGKGLEKVMRASACRVRVSGRECSCGSYLGRKVSRCHSGRRILIWPLGTESQSSDPFLEVWVQGECVHSPSVPQPQTQLIAVVSSKDHILDGPALTETWILVALMNVHCKELGLWPNVGSCLIANLIANLIAQNECIRASPCPEWVLVS